MASLEARIDALRPGIEGGFGPLNGQLMRQEAVLTILGSIPFRAIVETGTFRGTTTDFLHRRTDLPISTVELNPRFYRYAVRRFRKTPDIRVFRGDSRDFLARLARDPSFPKDHVFFYLDAHWGGKLPVVGEVELISRNWSDWVVLVDDFRVPDDPGYGFDDFGAQGKLDLDSLPLQTTSDLRIFWPTAQSHEETGSRRGSLWLASPGSMEQALRSLPVVRPDSSTPSHDSEA